MTQDIYVLRIWFERGHSETWRVTITDTRRQEKFHFATQEALFRFFQERLEATNNLSHGSEFDV